MDYGEKTDQELVRLSRRGDERAARELVHRFERPVFSIVYRMVRDRELAEDLSQDVFVRTFNNLDRYDRSYRFSSWLFKIAYNLTVDHLRKRDLPTISVHGAPDALTPDRNPAAPRGGTSLRGNLGNHGDPPWNGEDIHLSRPARAQGRSFRVVRGIGRLKPDTPGLRTVEGMEEMLS